MFAAIPCRNIDKAPIQKENLSKECKYIQLKTLGFSTLLSVPKLSVNNMLYVFLSLAIEQKPGVHNDK